MNDRSVPWDQLFAISSVPMSVVDSHGRQVAFNDAYAAFLGFEPSEVQSLDVGQVTRPEDQAWTRRYLMRLVSGEIDGFETEKVFVRKDGTEVRGRLSSRALFDAEGQCTYLMATIVPVADDDRAIETGVAERLLAHSVETITLVGADGLIRTTKGSDRTVHGYPASYWKDRPVADLLPGGDWERHSDLVESLLASPGATVERDGEIVTAEGNTRKVSARVTNCLDDPVLQGFVIVTRDVTEEREAMAELTRRRQTAEAVVDAQTRLLATVSHELRNPLHAVRGLAELLAAEDLGPRANELASSLLRQLSGLGHVTQDLLDAARLDAGKVVIEPVPTDLSALVDDVVGLGRAATGTKTISVTSRIAPGVPAWVFADTDRLRQVLSNLVGNAVKFTTSGSVQLNLRPSGEHAIVFSVVDTGVGIPADEQGAVLEPFAIGSTAGSSRGAGLGLSIVQRLVFAMNGRVSLTSSVGEGTRFDVTIPLDACDPPADVDHDELPTGIRVLVVEDNPVNQQLARSQLERLQLVPVIAGTGEEGLDLLVEAGVGGFDVVLMDQQLPGWSGTETTERIRALDGELSAIPVIGLSASASQADRDAFVSAGMNDFVAKPATLDDLKQAIGTAVRNGPPSSPEAVDEPLVPVEVAVGPDESGEPPVDGAVLARLSDELGGPDIVCELVRTFLDELPGRISAIADSDDETSIRRAAHTLKSSARLLGAGRLADACMAIEHGEMPSAQVSDLAAASRTAFEQWLYDRN